MSNVNPRKLDMLLISAIIGLAMGLITSCGAASASKGGRGARPACTAGMTEFSVFPAATVIDPAIRCDGEMECEFEYYRYAGGDYESESRVDGWCMRIPMTRTFAVDRNAGGMPRLVKVTIWSKDAPAQRTSITITQYGDLPASSFTK